MRRSSRPLCTALSLVAATPGCAEQQSTPAGVGLTRTCIESIAAQALANPRTNTMSANFAGPLGLTPTSDPNAAPWTNRQVEFAFSDGTMHYFAVDGPQWTRAVVIRLVPTTQPRSRVFVMDREGILLAAALITNNQLQVFNIQDPAVQVEFRTEQALWRLAGADDACGAS